jgi:cell surface protein SprA
MNIPKERNYDKPIKISPWDIENFDISYSYSQPKKSDVDVEMDNQFNHFGEIGYTYNNNPKNIRPFAKSKGLKSKWLQLIKDFNFNPLPKVVTVRTSITRELNAFKYRPKSQGNIVIDTSYIKTFNWARNYTVNWDLAQSLKIEYTANAMARIDEPDTLNHKYYYRQGMRTVRLKEGEVVTSTVKVTGDKTLGRADFQDI